jgi:hypothetical protein
MEGKRSGVQVRWNVCKGGIIIPYLNRKNKTE